MKSLWSADAREEVKVPVARPQLPTYDQIVPYLQRIDAARWYSNGGPLVREFEERLAEHCGGGAARVATVANATIGLTLALLAQDLTPGTFCMVPSWTFAATGHAILLAGLTPWIVDVSRESWMLEADSATALLPEAPGKVSAVIPVSPFGRPLEIEPWLRFRDRTGIAVVADAAAAFDRIRASAIPAVVSLHATKVCGVGEGGFVLSTDGKFIEEIQKRANFGFWNSRESTARSFNGKLSEYAAAVGLASLAAWPESRSEFLRVAQAYRQNLDGVESIRLQSGFGESWISTTVVVELRESDAEQISAVLAASGIGSRRWWGGGLHQHRTFGGFPRSAVKETESLAAQVIGLPCWCDLPNDEIRRICNLLPLALASSDR
jgi:dTDP-4-amino-4,6-dideoxygalactose transaminase